MRKFFSFFAITAVVLGMASCGDGNDPVIQYPEGAIHGLFSVSANKQIMFSQGNLQYHQDKAAAKDDHFAFAEHQYDVIGKEGNEGIDKVPCTIDLFGWGTGDKPRQTSTDDADYAEFHEWGNNRIRNGGNEANLWRTLTKDEWVYLFYDRANAATLFGLGSVNGVNGIILLPDNWVLPAGASFTASTTQGLEDQSSDYHNNNGNNFSHNTYSAKQWATMESAGAVFLPAAGDRIGTDVLKVGSDGRYWSASPSGTGIAYYLYFGLYDLGPQYGYYRNDGQSVRLVQDAR